MRRLSVVSRVSPRVSLGAALVLSVACANPSEPPPPLFPPEIGECGGPIADPGVTSGAGLEPWALPDCEGAMYSFYGDDEGYCEASYTVISVAAGWCAPCLEETAQIEARLNDRYAEHAVRTVQVLVQDNRYDEPTAEFCRTWTDRFGLTLPVLRDPNGALGAFTASGSLPVTIIVDGAGVIQNVERGGTPDWSTTTAVLDSLLEL